MAHVIGLKPTLDCFLFIKKYYNIKNVSIMLKFINNIELAWSMYPITGPITIAIDNPTSVMPTII
jgi:hypothetical protein